MKDLYHKKLIQLSNEAITDLEIVIKERDKLKEEFNSLKKDALLVAQYTGTADINDKVREARNRILDTVKE